MTPLGPNDSIGGGYRRDNQGRREFLLVSPDESLEVSDVRAAGTVVDGEGREQMAFVDRTGAHLLVPRDQQEPFTSFASSQIKTSIEDTASYPAAGNALTLHTLTGAGVIRALQMTHSRSLLARNGRIQVFVDGETLPSIDVEFGTLLCAQEDAWDTPGFYSTDHTAISISGSPYSDTCSGEITYPIPYSNGCIVKFYNPTETAGNNIFSAMYYQPGVIEGVTNRWRLRSADLPFRTAPSAQPGDITEFFDVQNVNGVLVYFAVACVGVTNYSYLERPWDIWVDGEDDPSYQGNSEDWWTAGYYFGGQHAFSSPNAMITAANNANFTNYAGVDLLSRHGGIPFTTGFRAAHGLTAEIKDAQVVTTDATVGAAALYYADVSEAFVPQAPVVTGESGDTYVDLSWTQESQGSSPITQYRITTSPSGPSTELAASATSAHLTGLTNGVAYTFSVVAVNDEGWSDPGTAVVTPLAFTVPDPPTGLAAVAGNGAATITFVAPVNTGNRPITGYEVTANPGGHSVTSSTVAPVIITGLTGGVTYTVTATATNSIGTSAASASTTVVPRDAPVLPTTGSATLLRHWAVDAINGKLNGDLIGTVPDLSSNNLPLVQGSDANKPTFKVNALNGLPTITSAADNIGYAHAFTQSQPVTIFAVIKPTNLAKARLITGLSGGNPILGVTSGNWQVSAGGAGAGVLAATVNQFQVLSVVLNGASSNLWLNGAIGTPANAGASNYTGLSVAVFTPFFYGEIQEIIVYSGAMSDSDRHLVEAYIEDRTAITMAVA